MPQYHQEVSSFSAPLLRPTDDQDMAFDQNQHSDDELIDNRIKSLDDYDDNYFFVTIIVVMVVLVVYFGIGLMIYHYWWGFTPLNALYFSVTTFTTIGYGDLVPSGANQRLFQSFIIIFGVGVGGAFLGVLHSVAQEHQEKVRNAKAERIVTKVRNSIYRRATSIIGNIGFFTRSSDVEKATPSLQESDLHNSEYINESSDHDNTSHHGSFSDTDSNINHNNNPNAHPSYLGRYSRSISKSFSELISKASGFMSSHTNPSPDNLQTIKEAFMASYDEELHEIQRNAIINLMVIFMIIAVGASAMSSIEDWDADQSIYWACVTICTIGYGDVVPSSSQGKWFTIFYAIIGCGYMAKSLTDLARAPIVFRLKRNEVKVLNQFTGELSRQKLEAIFSCELFRDIPRLKRSEGDLNKSEFVLLVLKLMNKVNEKDILLVNEIFETLDIDSKGYLSTEDMIDKLKNAKDEPTAKVRSPSDSLFSHAAETLLNIRSMADSFASHLRTSSQDNGRPGKPGSITGSTTGNTSDRSPRDEGSRSFRRSISFSSYDPPSQVPSQAGGTRYVAPPVTTSRSSITSSQNIARPIQQSNNNNNNYNNNKVNKNNRSSKSNNNTNNNINNNDSAVTSSTSKTDNNVTTASTSSESPSPVGGPSPQSPLSPVGAPLPIKSALHAPSSSSSSSSSSSPRVPSPTHPSSSVPLSRDEDIGANTAANSGPTIDIDAINYNNAMLISAAKARHDA